jgi:hypothetical protein
VVARAYGGLALPWTKQGRDKRKEYHRFFLEKIMAMDYLNRNKIGLTPQQVIVLPKELLSRKC